MDADAETLLRGPLFSGVEREIVSTVLRVGRRRSFSVLERLMRQDEVATSMYVILRGHVRVVRRMPDGNAVALAELGPGEGVGEIGLIDDRPRTATVVAIEPTETLEIDADAFETLSRSSPRFVELLARVLSHRLRSTNELLGGWLGDAAPALPKPAASRSSGQTPDANKALVARYRTLIARGDWTALEEILSPDFTAAGRPGTAALQADPLGVTAGLADLRTTIRQVIAEGDWVVELTTIAGVRAHAGPTLFVDEAAGERELSFPVVFLYRIEDGKIAERIAVPDDLRGAEARADS